MPVRIDFIIGYSLAWPKISFNCRLTAYRILEDSHPTVVACKAGDWPTLRRLFDEKLASITDRFGWHAGSFLHAAAEEGHYHMVESLLQQGIQVDVQDAYARTALHAAITCDYGYHIANLLITHGADLLNEDVLGSTAFHGEFTDTSRAVLKFHQEDVDYHCKDFVDMTMVYFVCLSKRTVPTDFLRCYKQDPTSFDRVSINGKTVLDIACLGGNLEMVEYLLQHKSPAFSLPPKAGNTPVHSAVFSDNVQIIDALFQDGFDIHAATDDGSTPLHAAVWFGRVAVVEKLLDLGAESDLTVVGRYGNKCTPFQQAVRYWCYDGRRTHIAKLLLARYPYLAAQISAEELAILTSDRTQEFDELELKSNGPPPQSKKNFLVSISADFVLKALGAYMLLSLLLRLWALLRSKI